MHCCANAQARATLVPMTQVPNLANLNLGIPAAGIGTQRQPRAIRKQIAQQREGDLKWNREIFVQCRNAVLNDFSVNRLETPDQMKAFLARVVRNGYNHVFVQHWLKGGPDDAISWAMHIWDWHYFVLRRVRLDNPNAALLDAGLTPWDPPTYPLTMQHTINDKLEQVTNILFEHHIARTGPNGAERSPANINDMLNDPVHAELLMLSVKAAFLEVFPDAEETDIFLVQTKDYWVDLEQRVLASEDVRRLSRGPVVANEEQEQVLAPCALPPCIRPPPRPVAGVEEQEEEGRAVVHHPSDDVELPLSFVRRGMR